MSRRVLLACLYAERDLKLGEAERLARLLDISPRVFLRPHRLPPDAPAWLEAAARLELAPADAWRLQLMASRRNATVGELIGAWLQIR